MTASPDANLVAEKGMPDGGPIPMDQGVSVFGKSPSVDVNIDNQIRGKLLHRWPSADCIFI